MFFISPLLSGCSVDADPITSLVVLCSFSLSAFSLWIVYSLLKLQMQKNPLNHYLHTENTYVKPPCEVCGKIDESELPEDNNAETSNTARTTCQRINEKRKTVIDVSVSAESDKKGDK